MLNFDPDLTALDITDAGGTCSGKAELQRLIVGYQLTLDCLGHDGKTLTQGLSKSIKQNLEHLEAAREKATPILGAPELDGSIFPIFYLSVANPLATAVATLDEAIQYTRRPSNRWVSDKLPTYRLTI